MKETLNFFTAEFPCGRGETFIENELPVLASRFKRINLIPFSASADRRKIPANVEVLNVSDGRVSFSAKKVFFGNLLSIASIMIQEYRNCGKSEIFKKNWRTYLSLLLRAFYDAELIINNVKEIRTAVNYSFWMNDWALALAVLKRKGMINSFVFRCGGYDIYDERHPDNYLPFRHFIYSQTAAIWPNSEMGVSYIKSKNMFPQKVAKQYWGTTDHGLANFDSSGIFRIVSCSNLIPLKRVHLILEILAAVKFKIEWVHFGSGVLEPEIRSAAAKLPENVQVKFMGNMPNQKVIEFYRNNSVNLFITTSETEGLPVSIQEAISFGIPVMATAVGGIPEIVNSQTGVLLDKDFSIGEASAILNNFPQSQMNEMHFRLNVRKFWLENFEAERIYSYFYTKLQELP
jgi:glycosyltransferase involved in cell wall biosynthesis